LFCFWESGCFGREDSGAGAMAGRSFHHPPAYKYHADQISMMLAPKTPAQLVGAYLRDGYFRLQLRPASRQALGNLHTLRNEIRARWGPQTELIDQKGDGFLEVGILRDYLTSLLALLIQGGHDLPRWAAVLGIDESGCALAIDIGQVPHILVAGADYQALLKVMAYSLSMRNPIGLLQMVVLMHAPSLELPHMLAPWKADRHSLQARRMLNDLKFVVDSRGEADLYPRLVLVVANPSTLPEADQDIIACLMKKPFVHVIAGDVDLDTAWRDRFPVLAEQLAPEEWMLQVRGSDRISYFQAATIGDEDSIIARLREWGSGRPVWAWADVQRQPLTLWQRIARR
jgi:hypothetical protein